VLYDYARG